jgi:hypothetical protein
MSKLLHSDLKHPTRSHNPNWPNLEAALPESPTQTPTHYHTHSFFDACSSHATIPDRTQIELGSAKPIGPRIVEGYKHYGECLLGKEDRSVELAEIMGNSYKRDVE